MMEMYMTEMYLVAGFVVGWLLARFDRENL